MLKKYSTAHTMSLLAKIATNWNFIIKCVHSLTGLKMFAWFCQVNEKNKKFVYSMLLRLFNVEMCSNFVEKKNVNDVTKES